MKPKEDNTEEITTSVAGDVIGDTAYSERFVLKILLKLANLDSLREEMNEKSFEDDLCILWDMTAEKDVVLFLQKHNVLNLFNFGLPVIESPRVLEIILGIIGNMCCQKEPIAALMKSDNFLEQLLQFINSDDSLLLIQLLRLINSALFLSEEDDIILWISLFEKVEYSKALYFILKNSSNKDLLFTATENLNTVCSYCNTSKTRVQFFSHFVSVEALENLTISFTELAVHKKEICEKHELERMFVICLQIILNFLGFENSLDVFVSCKKNIATVVKFVLLYYEEKLITQNDIDSDLVDIIDSTQTIANILQLSENNELECYFIPCYNMWKALSLANKLHEKGQSDFEDNNDDLYKFSKGINVQLSNIIIDFVLKCSDGALISALELIDDDYKCILQNVNNEDIESKVTTRITNYRKRLKESNVS